jgi:hypothetical protein
MKKEAYAESTIKAVGKRLAYLAKNCTLNMPEVVKGFVAQKDCSNAFKETLVVRLMLLCRFKISVLLVFKPVFGFAEKL